MKSKIVFATLLCATILAAQAGTPQNAFTPGQIIGARPRRSWTQGRSLRYWKAILGQPPAISRSG